MSMRSDYGPEVWCDETGQIEATHRPAGSRDPWFCMVCGSIEHKATRPESAEAVR